MQGPHDLLIERALTWLRNDVFPLWKTEGVFSKTGAFVETLSFNRKALDQPLRSMVQARQMYAFRIAGDLGVLEKKESENILSRATEHFLRYHSQADGSFCHAVDSTGTVVDPSAELYTQSFALFGLAQSYRIFKDSRIKDRAQKLVEFLRRHRRAPGGGFTEIKDKKIVFRSNPHMHLFEAALVWMEIDKDPLWSELAQEILRLCLTRFIDPSRHLLAEYFDSEWKPLLEGSKFVWEPGHHFEWAWLMAVYEDLSEKDLRSARHRLFEKAEAFGVQHETKLAIDEVWSDHTAKSLSSRFWPQCERIKAAVKLGTDLPIDDQGPTARAADEALESLFMFLTPLRSGLWQDTRLANGEFKSPGAKASSLYHIINAIYEYVMLRPELKR